MTRFLVTPLWQGSPSSRAMLLRDGAEAIAGDLPRAKTRLIDVPSAAGDALGTAVRRLSAFRWIDDVLGEALSSDPETAVVIGGGATVSIPALTRAAAGGADDLAVVWIAAHPALNDADSSDTGALDGMALRAVLGDVPDAVPIPALAPERVVLVAARERDPGEEAYLFDSAVTELSARALDDPAALAAAVRATGASRVYVHIELDALDPSVVTGTLAAVPFGLEAATLVAAVAALRAEVAVAGATIAGFAPSSPDAAVDDLGTILRLVGAVA